MCALESLFPTMTNHTKTPQNLLGFCQNSIAKRTFWDCKGVFHLDCSEKKCFVWTRILVSNHHQPHQNTSKPLEFLPKPQCKTHILGLQRRFSPRLFREKVFCVDSMRESLSQTMTKHTKALQNLLSFCQNPIAKCSRLSRHAWKYAGHIST